MNNILKIEGSTLVSCDRDVSGHIEIPNIVTEIGRDSFKGCTGLTSIKIPNSVTAIGYCAFAGCTGLTSIVIPNSVASIGGRSFSGCISLTSVYISDGVTKICDSTFFGCTSLTRIVIPYGVTKIGRFCFFDCKSLTSIEIPISVKEIGERAFEGCTDLTKVEIPSSVKDIGECAFTSCTILIKQKAGWSTWFLDRKWIALEQERRSMSLEMRDLREEIEWLYPHSYEEEIEEKESNKLKRNQLERKLKKLELVSCMVDLRQEWVLKLKQEPMGFMSPIQHRLKYRKRKMLERELVSLMSRYPEAIPEWVKWNYHYWLKKAIERLEQKKFEGSKEQIWQICVIAWIIINIGLIFFIVSKVQHSLLEGLLLYSIIGVNYIFFSRLDAIVRVIKRIVCKLNIKVN